ncbi:MAG: YhcH/YjgK/YiaL family protein [Alistipes sp.]|nr:YhcH/YjgK/YiaL family protein [Candidatus Minthomonas equi]
MIIDSIRSFERYVQIHEHFSKVYDFLTKHDLHSLEPGKYDIDGGNVWVSITEKEAVGLDSTPEMEVHDSYIDIHVPLVGTETIAWRDRAKCSGVDVEYDAENDFALLKEEPEVYVSVDPDNFVICFPKDAHAPMMGTGIIRKAIFKVRA